MPYSGYKRRAVATDYNYIFHSDVELKQLADDKGAYENPQRWPESESRPGLACYPEPKSSNSPASPSC